MKIISYKLYNDNKGVIFENTNKQSVLDQLSEEKTKDKNNTFRIVDYARHISDVDITGDIYIKDNTIYMNSFLGEVNLTELFTTYNDTKINLSIKVKGGSTTI